MYFFKNSKEINLKKKICAQKFQKTNFLQKNMYFFKNSKIKRILQNGKKKSVSRQNP